MKIQQLQEVLLQEIDLNHYMILTMIHQQEPIETIKNIKVQGWLNMMIMKELIAKKDGKYFLIEKGLNLIKKVGLTEVVVKMDQKILLTDLMKKNDVYDYNALHLRLKEQLKKLIGSSQYFLQVQGNKYPYLCGATDLKLKIEKFKQVYKLTDMEKIEKCLMRHLSIHNQKLIYYIIREKGDSKSDLAGDYENFDELKAVPTVHNNKTTDI